ncbi:MAG: threonine dehydratase [Myxococcota bacterium]
MNLPTTNDVVAAHDRIRAHVHRTPVFTSRTLDERVGGTVFLKAENFQRVGAFKFRGAVNAVLSLSDAAASQGVVTHSSGNHAQAVALAATLRGIPAWVVMPDNAPAVKVAAVRGYGATIVMCAALPAAREETAEAVRLETGATFIHPSNDAMVIAGQGTAARELLQDIDGLDLVLAPLGGGGILSGTALAAIEFGVRVIGVEPEAADDGFRSLQAGKILDAGNPQTIADGLRTSLGSRTFPLIRDHVERVVTVSESAIVEALRFVYERMKLVVEPSAVVTIAAMLDGQLNVRGLRVGAILTGGNMDAVRLGALLA